MAPRRYSFARLIGGIRNELAREKRKAIILLILATVMCALMVRLVWSTSSPARAEGAIAPSCLADLESSGPAKVPFAPPAMLEMDQPVATTEAPHFAHERRKITRDLFAPDPEVFPPKQARSSVGLAPEGEGTSNPEAENEAQRRIVWAHARALVLQSTIISDNPIGIINGRVLRVGDWINGFQMLAITPRSCTLEKRGVKVILEMNREEKQQVQSPK